MRLQHNKLPSNSSLLLLLFWRDRMEFCFAKKALGWYIVCSCACPCLFHLLPAASWKWNKTAGTSANFSEK